MPGTATRIRAGRMRDLVRIQARTDIVDSAGGFQAQWVNVGDERVQVDRISGVEGVLAQELMAANVYRVIMRFRDDVTTKHRLVLVGAPNQPDQPDLLLNIKSINLDGKRSWLILICEQGLTDG